MAIDREWAARERAALRLPVWMQNIADGRKLHPLVDHIFSPAGNLFEFEDITPFGAEVVPLWDADTTMFCHWENPEKKRKEFILFRLGDGDRYQRLGQTPIGVAGEVLVRIWNYITEDEEFEQLPQFARMIGFPNFGEFIEGYERALDEEDDLADDDADPAADYMQAFADTH